MIAMGIRHLTFHGKPFAHRQLEQLSASRLLRRALFACIVDPDGGERKSLASAGVLAIFLTCTARTRIKPCTVFR